MLGRRQRPGGKGEAALQCWGGGGGEETWGKSLSRPPSAGGEPAERACGPWREEELPVANRAPLGFSCAQPLLSFFAEWGGEGQLSALGDPTLDFPGRG